MCGNQKRKGWGTCKLGKVNANKVEEAVIQQVFDRILTRDYLSGLLEEVRSSFNIEEMDKELAEGRHHLRELDKVLDGLVDAIEQSPSSTLMIRLAGRERERDETLARVAALEIERRDHEDTQIDPQTLDLLVDELRRGLEVDHATVRDTLQRIVTKVEIKKDGGTLHLRVPLRAVLSVGTPGATRTPAHGFGGRRSIRLSYGGM